GDVADDDRRGVVGEAAVLVEDPAVNRVSAGVVEGETAAGGGVAGRQVGGTQGEAVAEARGGGGRRRVGRTGEENGRAAALGDGPIIAQARGGRHVGHPHAERPRRDGAVAVGLLG